MRIGRIHIPDNTTDTSLFCLPVQANGVYAFKLALWLIYGGPEGVDASIVELYTMRQSSKPEIDRGSDGGDCEGVNGKGIREDHPGGPVCRGDQSC